MSSPFYGNMPKYFSGTFSPSDYEFISQRFHFRFTPNNEIKIWTVTTSGLVRVLFKIIQGCVPWLQLRETDQLWGNFWGGTEERMYWGTLWLLVYENKTNFRSDVCVWHHILWLISQPIYFSPLEQIVPVLTYWLPNAVSVNSANKDLTITRPPNWKLSMLCKVQHLIHCPSLLLSESGNVNPQYELVWAVEHQGWNPISVGSLGWLGHEQEVYRHRPRPRWQRPHTHAGLRLSDTDGGERGGWFRPPCLGDTMAPPASLIQRYRQHQSYTS